MLIKNLISEADKAAFLTAFSKNDGSSIDSDYLQRGSVWGLYQQGRLVAGFIVNRLYPLRYFEHFSPSYGLQLLQRNQLTNVVEIACIWHERKDTFTIGQKSELYVQSILKAISWQSWLQNAPIMGGSFNPKVAKRQKTLLNKQLFRDELLVNGKLHEAQIYYGRSLRVMLILPLAIGWMIVQEIGKRRKNYLVEISKKWSINNLTSFLKKELQ